jgi:hypothetical protein
VQADLQEGGRHGVLGILVVAQFRVGQGEQPEPRPRDQCCQRIRVAIAGPQGQRVFIRFSVHHGTRSGMGAKGCSDARGTFVTGMLST